MPQKKPATLGSLRDKRRPLPGPGSGVGRTQPRDPVLAREPFDQEKFDEHGDLIQGAMQRGLAEDKAHADYHKEMEESGAYGDAHPERTPAQDRDHAYFLIEEEKHERRRRKSTLGELRRVESMRKENKKN